MNGDTVSRQAGSSRALPEASACQEWCGAGFATLLKVLGHLSLSFSSALPHPDPFLLYSKCASVHTLLRYSLSGRLQQLGLGSVLMGAQHGHGSVLNK